MGTHIIMQEGCNLCIMRIMGPRRHVLYPINVDITVDLTRNQIATHPHGSLNSMMIETLKSLLIQRLLF